MQILGKYILIRFQNKRRTGELIKKNNLNFSMENFTEKNQ